MLWGKMRNLRNKPTKFVPESYKENNDWAVERVQNYLRNIGYQIFIKNKEDYKIDIKAKRNSRIVYFEVEVKTGYPFTGMEDFPFPTVSFLARKKKWADIGFYYVIISKETTAITMSHSDIIYRDEYKEKFHVDTPRRYGSDVFYRVPKHKCLWF